jgi:HAD superfamily, subfamily IIIB (Acid phosphatase)
LPYCAGMKRTSTVLATVAAVLALTAVPAAAAETPAPANVSAATLPPYTTWIEDVTGVADEAADYLDDRLPDAAVKPAIVLDIDNTALQTQYRPGLASPATGPILEVARQARADGAAVFFVTARPEILRLQTQANMRPWFDTRSDQALKTDARTAIEQQGYTIVANIGNNDSDLAGGHAERTFKLPDYDGRLG